MVEIIDIAGLVKGASQGIGLGNEFLSHIREVDLICQVLRCFPEKEIINVEKTVNPLRDFETIQLELIWADLQQITRKLKKLKVGDKKSQKEQKLLQLIQTKLNQGISLNQLDLTQEEKETIRAYNFLTAKPFFLLLNYSGNEAEIKKIIEFSQTNRLHFFPLAVKLESQIKQLSLAERQEIGLGRTNFTPLAEKIKDLLKLKTFFTVGTDETRSWLTRQETNAKECAGLIHSDLQKGFIQVEVYNYNEWEINLNESQSTTGNKIKKEGARYVVKEGDICYFISRKV